MPVVVVVIVAAAIVVVVVRAGVGALSPGWNCACLLARLLALLHVVLRYALPACLPSCVFARFIPFCFGFSYLCSILLYDDY